MNNHNHPVAVEWEKIERGGENKAEREENRDAEMKIEREKRLQKREENDDDRIKVGAVDMERGDIEHYDTKARRRRKETR